jgi:hypothetical protein
MAFDMGALSRIGFAYVAPAGAPTVNPRFWAGFALRHVVLIPIAVLLQYVIRNHTGLPSTEWIVLGVLAILYTGLLMYDSLRLYMGLTSNNRWRGP